VVFSNSSYTKRTLSEFSEFHSTSPTLV
jgi:hypothetical protein